MSDPDSRRVVARLRSLTGGLEMTDQDLDLARTRLDRRLRQPDRRPRALIVAAVAAVIAVIAAVALTQGTSGHKDSAPPVVEPNALDPKDWNQPESRFLDGPAPSARDVVGLWHLRISDDQLLMALGADGSWAMGSLAGLLDDPLTERGTYTVGDGVVTFHHADGVCVGVVGSAFDVGQRAALMPDGSLHLHDPQVDEEEPFYGIWDCRASVGHRTIWDRVLPGPSTLLATSPSGSDWTVPTDPFTSVRRGVYVSDDGAWALVVDEGRGYRAYRGPDLFSRPADTGAVQAEQRGPGRLTLTCRGGSVTADVETTVASRADGVLSSTEWLRGHVVTDTCASGIGRASWRWLRLLP